MIKQNLLECNHIERSEDEVTARAGLKVVPSESASGDWLLGMGKWDGIEGRRPSYACRVKGVTDIRIS